MCGQSTDLGLRPVYRPQCAASLQTSICGQSTDLDVRPIYIRPPGAASLHTSMCAVYIPRCAVSLHTSMCGQSTDLDVRSVYIPRCAASLHTSMCGQSTYLDRRAVGADVREADNVGEVERALVEMFRLDGSAQLQFLRHSPERRSSSCVKTLNVIFKQRT